MSRIKLKNIVSRITVGAFAIFVVLMFVACDGFYTDSLPTPDIAQPTPANVQEGDPETLIEVLARDAMALSLGISASAPRKILFEHETWTDRNPGCYPAPDSITGNYLIPGYRLLMQHDGVFYEYNADQGAATGALCDSTIQTVPVEPAFSIVTISESSAPDADSIHVIRSEEDVAEFNSTFSGTATVGVDEIEFPDEVLVGGWVQASPNAEATRAFKSEDGSLITIEVAIPEEFAEDSTDEWAQIWALVDTTESDTTYEFVVTN
ncbi:hypothetical protein JYU04_01425 [Dehalococcoides mccartyi]|nr:hypothetical protein [Dehalococcoides mccartyi]